MGTFHHFGVPTTVPQDNETYLEDAMVYVSDPEAHPYRIEFLRFEPGSPMHPDVINKPHAAYMVNDMEAELVGKQVIIEPFVVADTVKVAFFNENGAVIELMQAL